MSSCAAALLGDIGDQHQLVWIAHRQRFQDERVEDGQNRGVWSDAERESDQHRQAEPRRAAQRAEGELEFLPSKFQPDPAALVAGGLLDAVEMAELAAGGVTSVVGRHPPGNILRGFHFKVSAHFLSHVAVEFRTPKESTETGEELHLVTRSRRRDGGCLASPKAPRA